MEMHTPVEFPQDVTSELHGLPNEIAAASFMPKQLHDLARIIIRDAHHLVDVLRGWGGVSRVSQRLEHDGGHLRELDVGLLRFTERTLDK